MVLLVLSSDTIRSQRMILFLMLKRMNYVSGALERKGKVTLERTTPRGSPAPYSGSQFKKDVKGMISAAFASKLKKQKDKDAGASEAKECHQYLVVSIFSLKMRKARRNTAHLP